MRFLYWAACGTMFTFAMTALGSALVFFFRSPVSDRMNRVCLGFAGGVMSAASVFSLLLPAAQQAAEAGDTPWLVLTIGFLLGSALLMALDRQLERVAACRHEDRERRRQALLFSAVTLHNVPEGMAVALACAAAAPLGGAGLASAAALALGVGVQNYPEGAAISLPLYQGGMSRGRSFLLGALSGVVEPVFGLLAAFLAASVSGLMPLLMAFAAGAMMHVVYAQMLPEAGESRGGAAAAVVGFALMMALDVALG